MTVELGQVPKVTGEMSKNDVALLLPHLADDGIQSEADEEVDEEAGVDLKQAMLGQREMASEQEIEDVAEEDGEQGLEEV